MNKHEIPILDAAIDLRANQYRAVNIGGTLATGPMNAHGLLCTRTDSGEDGSATVWGRERFVAGGAVVAGGRVKVAPNGFLVAAASGDTSCGFAEVAVTSGSVGRGWFDFITQTYHISSNGIG